MNYSFKERETDRQTNRQRQRHRERRERGIRMIYSFRPLPLMKESERGGIRMIYSFKERERGGGYG